MPSSPMLHQWRQMKSLQAIPVKSHRGYLSFASMEIVMQWLDNLDDLFGAIGLVRERIRNFLIATSTFLVAVLTQFAAVKLALRHPPLALATAMLLFVMLLYRSVTTPPVQLRRPV